MGEHYGQDKRDYMRWYMKRYRRLGKGLREERALRPIVPPPARYADLAAAVFGDPPIGRRAIDAKQLIAYQRPVNSRPSLLGETASRTFPVERIHDETRQPEPSDTQRPEDAT